MSGVPGNLGFEALAFADIDQQGDGDGRDEQEGQAEYGDDQAAALFDVGRLQIDHFFQALLVVPEILAGVAPRGDVVNDRKKQASSIESVGAAEYLNRTDGFVGQLMPEDEIVTPFGFGQTAFLGHLLVGEGVDLLDRHLPQLVALVTVETAGRRIGIDDFAAFRIDEQHGGCLFFEDFLE